MVIQGIDFIFSIFSDIFGTVVSLWPLAFCLLLSILSLIISLIVSVRNK